MSACSMMVYEWFVGFSLSPNPGPTSASDPSREGGNPAREGTKKIKQDDLIELVLQRRQDLDPIIGGGRKAVQADERALGCSVVVDYSVPDDARRACRAALKKEVVARGLPLLHRQRQISRRDVPAVPANQRCHENCNHAKQPHLRHLV